MVTSHMGHFLLDTSYLVFLKNLYSKVALLINDNQKMYSTDNLFKVPHLYPIVNYVYIDEKSVIKIPKCL